MQVRVASQSGKYLQLVIWTIFLWFVLVHRFHFIDKRHEGKKHFTVLNLLAFWINGHEKSKMYLKLYNRSF